MSVATKLPQIGRTKQRATLEDSDVTDEASVSSEEEDLEDYDDSEYTEDESEVSSDGDGSDDDDDSVTRRAAGPRTQSRRNSLRTAQHNIHRPVSNGTIAHPTSVVPAAVLANGNSDDDLEESEDTEAAREMANSHLSSMSNTNRPKTILRSSQAGSEVRSSESRVLPPVYPSNPHGSSNVTHLPPAPHDKTVHRTSGALPALAAAGAGVVGGSRNPPRSSGLARSHNTDSNGATSSSDSRCSSSTDSDAEDFSSDSVSNRSARSARSNHSNRSSGGVPIVGTVPTHAGQQPAAQSSKSQKKKRFKMPFTHRDPCTLQELDAKIDKHRSKAEAAEALQDASRNQLKANKTLASNSSAPIGRRFIAFFARLGNWFGMKRHERAAKSERKKLDKNTEKRFILLGPGHPTAVSPPAGHIYPATTVSGDHTSS